MITRQPGAGARRRRRRRPRRRPGDLVVFDAPTPEDALRRVTPRFLVLRDGVVVARTRPATTTVTTFGETREVTFLRPTT